MKAFSSIIISILFATLLILIPWEELKGSAFVDKSNYLDYVYYQNNVLDYRLFDSFFSYISYEWLWHFILLNIGDILPYEIFFNTISFAALVCISYFLVRRYRFMSLFLLINPLIIDLTMSQYRICLALIFVMLATFLNKYKKMSVFLVLVASLIHSSVMIFIVIYIAIKLISELKFKNRYLEVILLVILGLTISFLLSDFIKVVLEKIGDRRSGYEFDRISSSLSYLSFWILNMIIVIFNYSIIGIKSTKDKLTIVILTLVSGNVLFGGYSTRILALFLPVIMSTNLELIRQLKVIIIPLYLLYSALQWIYWFT